MKTRKFLWALLPMMAAALMTTACSSDDDSTSVSPKPAADQTVKSIPYTVTVGQGTTTRASVDGDDITLRFAEGDELYVEGENGNVYGRLTLQSGDAGKNNGATFSGNLNYTGSAPADNLELTAILVGANNELANVSGDKVMGFENYPTTICATMAEAVQKYSKLTGTGTYGAKNFALSQETAFMKFSVTLEDGTTNGATVPVVIKNGSNIIGTGSVTATGENQFIDIKADFVLPVAKGTSIAANSTMCVANVGEDTESITYSSTAKTLSGGVYTITKTKDFVRLWAGGPVWATKNLGATSVSGYGDYYCWAGTTNVNSTVINLGDSYNWNSNCPYCAGQNGNGYPIFTKYFSNISGWSAVWGGTGPYDMKKELDSTDDAATVNLGSPWRIPTPAETGSYMSSGLCGTTQDHNATVNGINGVKFTGKDTYAGKALFLPKAGKREGTSLEQGYEGNYWTSKISQARDEYADCFALHWGICDTEMRSRNNGHSIRPVHD
ncbi:MAG: hypothetical protein J6O23_08405 [Prevotella sp.]|nr:hypothetical protein [Prevotella sp.]